MKTPEEKFCEEFDKIILDKKMKQAEKWNYLIFARVYSKQAKEKEQSWKILFLVLVFVFVYWDYLFYLISLTTTLMANTYWLYCSVWD